MEVQRLPAATLGPPEVRDRFGLLAQHAIRAIKVVADSYKAAKMCEHTFRLDAAVALDTPRLYRLRATLASPATLAGCIEVPLAIGGKLHFWSFDCLRRFIAYKAAMSGVLAVYVDARNTSRTCPAYGHCTKDNRPSRAHFLYVDCGFAGRADHTAAVNIRARGRAAVIQPNASEASHPAYAGSQQVCGVAPGASPLL